MNNFPNIINLCEYLLQVNLIRLRVRKAFLVRLHHNDISRDSGIVDAHDQPIPRQTPERTGSSLGNEDRNPPINDNQSQDQNAPITYNLDATDNDTQPGRQHRPMKTWAQ